MVPQISLVHVGVWGVGSLPVCRQASQSSLGGKKYIYTMNQQHNSPFFFACYLSKIGHFFDCRFIEMTWVGRKRWEQYKIQPGLASLCRVHLLCLENLQFLGSHSAVLWAQLRHGECNLLSFCCVLLSWLYWRWWASTQLCRHTWTPQTPDSTLGSNGVYRLWPQPAHNEIVVSSPSL